MNRIDRISAILIHLQSRKIVRAQDIADRFNISLRTVYRDIRTLEEAGIPLMGEAGVGYSIMDGYRLPPVMFTTEEATAFLTAEKLVEKLTDHATKDSYRSAMYKIKAVLKGSEKENLEYLESHIEVLDNEYIPRDGRESNHIQFILKSIALKEMLKMDYFSNHSQERNQRLIEPVGIFYMNHHWHLIAYCHMRKDYRHFRTDRIFDLSGSGRFFEKQHPAFKSFLERTAREEELSTVIIYTPKHLLAYFGDQKYYNGFVSQKEVRGLIEMTFLTSSLEGFARWCMMFGDTITIKSPESLKARVREISHLIIRHQSSGQSAQ